MSSLADPIKEWLLTAHPNPDRVGCFPAEVIRDLANKRLPANHPVVEHLDNCSPCYREFSVLLDTRQAAEHKKRQQWINAAGSAVLVVVSVGGWIVATHHSTSSFVAGGQRLPLGVIDLSTASNRDQGSIMKEQVISRNIGAVAITVPRRDQPGPYEVEIRRASDNQVVLRFVGTISQDNSSGNRTLRAIVSFAQLAPGWYQMLWFRKGSPSAEVGEFRIQ